MGLTATWAVLVGLSLVSTGLAGQIGAGHGGRAVLAVILLLAWLKAHLILKHYLGLARCPPVLRGFDIVLALTMMALLGLALMG